MRQPLEDFGESRYDRPNHKWSCGLGVDGEACALGPSAGGLCPRMAECTPRQEGSRWVCGRSTWQGGPCDQGPDPEGRCVRVQICEPQRSLRNRRGRFVAANACFVLGALIFVLNTTWRDDFLTPGPLAQSHALSMASERSSDQCGACHAQSTASIWNWLSSSARNSSQSELCMRCHDHTIPAEFALAPHGVAPSRIAGQVSQSPSSWIDGDKPGPRADHGFQRIACASCHRDHRGPRVDLTAIDNHRCQTCHRQQYDSFANEHPDFSHWPFERRTRIAFDHTSHSARHFPKEKRDFVCRDCHVDDETQRVKLLADYEQSCAECHESSIRSSMTEGIAFLSMPSVDNDLLADVGHGLASWPAAATGEFDGAISPPMVILLASDAQARAALRMLGADSHFADVDLANPLELQAAAQVAQSIQRLLLDVARQGHQAIRDRLARVLGRSIDDGELARLVGRLSSDTLARAAKSWTGNRAPPDSPTASEAAADLHGGGWFHDNLTTAIRYRPVGHGDPWLVAWLEAAAEWEAQDTSGLAQQQLARLTDVNAAGQCISCHSVDRLPDGSVAINWYAYDGRLLGRRPTKFSHRPHLTQPSLRDCTFCHQIDSTAEPMASYRDFDPHTFVSGFLPMSKQNCVTCHTSRAAGDACQQCHHYHVETWP